MKLIVVAIVDLKTEEVFLQVRDSYGRLCPRVAEKIWRAIKRELKLY